MSALTLDDVVDTPYGMGLRVHRRWRSRSGPARPSSTTSSPAAPRPRPATGCSGRRPGGSGPTPLPLPRQVDRDNARRGPRRHEHPRPAAHRRVIAHGVGGGCQGRPVDPRPRLCDDDNGLLRPPLLRRPMAGDGDDAGVPQPTLPGNAPQSGHPSDRGGSASTSAVSFRPDPVADTRHEHLLANQWQRQPVPRTWEIAWRHGAAKHRARTGQAAH